MALRRVGYDQSLIALNGDADAANATAKWRSDICLNGCHQLHGRTCSAGPWSNSASVESLPAIG